MSHNNKIIGLLFIGIMSSIFLFACQPKKQSLLSQSHQSKSLCEKHSFLKIYKCSFERVQSEAYNGNSNAQYALGYMYYYGIGVSPNKRLALQWIQASAKRGNLSAQEALKLLNKNKKTKFLSSKSMYHNKSRKSVGRKKNSQIASGTCVKGTGYTIQIIAGRNFSKLRQFSLQNQRYFKTKPFIYRTTMNSAPWFILTYGRYSTYAQARRDLYRLPEQLKTYHPWVKPCSTLSR